jgi:selenocysteine lyase/cysteine desulfurase
MATGLGALLVRKELLPVMTAQKPYFGGGTVAASCAEEDWFARYGTRRIKSITTQALTLL